MVKMGGSYGSSSVEEEARAPRPAQRSYKVIIASVAASLAMIAFIAVIMQPSMPTELEAQQDTQKALSLELSKQKYDTAKARVKKLHSEFDQLKAQLAAQVKHLQDARGDLVGQISSVEGGSSPVLQSTAETSDVGDAATSDADTYEPSPQLKKLRDAAAALASAGTSRDAADAATHALSYTQQVASRVGDLADQSEEQAKRIVDAARLAQEAKEAMRAALEQSSKIVDYNTHAAQAVAQDSGFVTTAAQTISGYLHNIFHDSRAVHAAAVSAVKHMNADVTAADHAVSEIESDAQEAYDVLEHIHAADKAATNFARHSRAAAITAATAANGALKGERAAMVGGLKAIASAHSAQAGAQAAMEYARAAQSAVHPFIYGGVAPSAPAPEAAPAAEGGVSDLMGAKQLVDAVVVLMQQLTNALESAEDCDKVHEILTYYQATMAKYHQEGQEIAGSLTATDMNLVEQYAQTQVAAFASELEEVVRKTADKCSVPVESFIPDASVEKKAAAPQATLASVSSPALDEDANAAQAKIAKLTKELAWVKRERLLQKQTQGGSMRAVVKRAPSSELEAAVQHEQRRVNELKAQIASLQQEKASLTDRL